MACCTVQDPNGCDELRQVLLHVDKVGFVDGRDAGFEDLRAHEFPNAGCRWRVWLLNEVIQERAYNARDDTTATSVMHPERVRAKQDDRLQDFG